MDTYTIRALTTADAALAREAAERLQAYDDRAGLTPENNASGAWDLRQGALLAENLRIALEIIERITRP